MKKKSRVPLVEIQAGQDQRANRVVLEGWGDQDYLASRGHKENRETPYRKKMVGCSRCEIKKPISYFKLSILKAEKMVSGRRGRYRSTRPGWNNWRITPKRDSYI